MHAFCSRRLDPYHTELLFLSSTPASSSTEQAAHHVYERVALPRPRDAKVHLSDRFQRLVPCTHLGYIGRVLGDQMLVDIRTATLDGQKQKSEEIEEGQ